MILNDLKERIEDRKDVNKKFWKNNFFRGENKRYEKYHDALVEEYLNDVGPVSKEINENLKKLEEHVIKKR